jgi:hypothetical protein
MESKIVDAVFRGHWERTWDRLTEKEPLAPIVPWKVLIAEIYKSECGGSEEERRIHVFNMNLRQQVRMRPGKGRPKELLNAELYNELKQRSGGLCEICGKSVGTKGVKGLHIDHCHETGHIRGLLCGRCNTSVERVESDPAWGKKAFMYLANAKVRDKISLQSDLTK